MTATLLEIEGTADEIAERLHGFAERKLHVTVRPVEEDITEPKDTRPIAEVLAEIAARIPPSELAKLPPDFTDQLDHYSYGSPKTGMKAVQILDIVWWIAFR